MVFPPFFEWGDKPLELFKLFGIISVNTSDANKSLEETSGKAEQTQGKLGKAFDKIGSAAVACGKVIATGLAVGTAAFSSLMVNAMSLAGELEQNMGGAAAVFGEHASKMEDAAKTAFSQMGLSASDFLGTANKMGSLFKGAGFEAGEAADLTASAMQRAADVASIMGIDVSVAMESIAGAAKGNFTMMDNLGVAMNDTNLQAYALSKGIKTATKDMTSQEKIGLAMQMFLEKTADYAGNYAKENETLAGSLTTAKAAWSNFLSGVGDANEVANALANTGKVISQKLLGLLPALVTGLSTLFNALIPELPPLLQSLLPAVIDGAVGLIEGVVSASETLINALMGIVPSLMKAAGQIMESLGTALIDNIDFILDSALQIAEMLAFGLLEALPKIAEAACTIVEKIGFWIEENAQFVIESGINLMSKLASTLVVEIPKLISAVAKAVVKALPALLKSFSALWTQLNEGTLIVGGLLIAFKGFSIITKVVSLVKTLKAAFASLNIVMNANPIGMLTSGIGLAIAAFGGLLAATKDATLTTHKLSDEFVELEEEIEGARKAFDELNEEYAKDAWAIEQETQRTEDLWKELQTLADETGYVTDANKDRASYLLGELNEALGTEYEMNGNIIGQYHQMQDEIDTLIQKRRAERLFESYGDMYDKAQTDLTATKERLSEAQTTRDNYYAQRQAANSELTEYLTYLRETYGANTFGEVDESLLATDPYEAIGLFQDALFDAMDNVGGDGAVTSEDISRGHDLAATLARAYGAIVDEETGETVDAGEYYDRVLADATDAYLDAERTMERYNQADYAMATGNYEEATALLLDGSAAYLSALREGKEITSEQRAELEQSLKQEEAALRAYHDRAALGDPLLTMEKFGEMVSAYADKVALLDGYTFDDAYIGGLVNEAILNNAAKAEDIELQPVALDDDAQGEVHELRTEITRLSDTLRTLFSDVQIKINNREFGRLVRAELK